MDMSDILALLSRWAHIVAVITLVGGTFFMRFALVPAAIQHSTDSALRDAIRKRWTKFVMLSILFLLVSGFYNAYLKAMGFHLSGVYLALLTIKIVVGFAIFFLVSRLGGRSEKAQQFRAKETHWLNIICSLMLLLVLMAGYMKLSDHPVKERDADGKTIPLQQVD